jgi:hypothetical protein
VTAQDIARFTYSHKSTISLTVQDLEDRGLIARKISAADNRRPPPVPAIAALVLEFAQNLITSISDADAQALRKGLTTPVSAVNRRPILTPYRHPILTPLG